MSRQRKIGLAVLGVGVVALIADRLFFAPASAEAAEAAAAAHAVPTLPSPRPPRSPRPPVEKPQEGPAPITLATRIAGAAKGTPWDDRYLPDAFFPAASWLTQAMMGPPLPPRLDMGPTTPENRPLGQYHLMMIFRGADGKAVGAMIDNKHYTVGQFLDGMKIIAIYAERDDRRVVLEGPGGPLTLELSSGPVTPRR